MKTYHNFVLLFLLACSFATSAQLPQLSDPALQVASLMQVKANAVRIARNPIDHNLYYITFNGNIYKIIQSGSSYYDT